MPSDFTERINQIIATITLANAAMGARVQTYYDGLDPAEKPIFSKLFSLGYRGIGRKQESRTRQRKLVRAVACLRFITGDESASDIINEIQTMSEVNLQTRLNLECQDLVNRASAVPITTHDGNNSVNCYAWACRCLNPTIRTPGGQTVPGKVNNTPHPELVGSPELYVRGAMDDGLTLVARSLAPVPHHGGGTNLIAAMAAGFGFHWVKREDDGFWSWKNGNLNPVFYNAMPKATRETKVGDRMYMKIRDQDLKYLVGPFAERKYHFGYDNLKFMAYFYVPNGGITVASPPGPH